jgi:hypothetical protein
LLFSPIARAQGSEEIIEALEHRSCQNPRWHFTTAAGDQRKVKNLGSSRPTG